jgi:methionine--tRNA ligase beta chain
MTISFDDFEKLDIRIGRIEEAERIEGSDKLLKLKVDIGSEHRTLVAGIAQQYVAEDMVGKLIVVLTNLEPKKIRGIESQGMMLAADEEGRPVFLKPEKDVAVGTRVR